MKKKYWLITDTRRKCEWIYWKGKWKKCVVLNAVGIENPKTLKCYTFSMKD